MASNLVEDARMYYQRLYWHFYPSLAKQVLELLLIPDHHQRWSSTVRAGGARQFILLPLPACLPAGWYPRRIPIKDFFISKRYRFHPFVYHSTITTSINNTFTARSRDMIDLWLEYTLQTDGGLDTVILHILPTLTYYQIIFSSI